MSRNSHRPVNGGRAAAAETARRQEGLGRGWASIGWPASDPTPLDLDPKAVACRLGPVEIEVVASVVGPIELEQPTAVAVGLTTAPAVAEVGLTTEVVADAGLTTVLVVAVVIFVQPPIVPDPDSAPVPRCRSGPA